MYFNELLETLFDKFPESANKANLTEKYKRKLNLSWKDVYRAYQWEFRKRSAQLLVTPNYTTGTAAITKYDGTNWATACTVSISNALNVDMAGRYFRPNGSSNWYRILYGNSGATQIILENPTVENSQTDTFEIWKRFHALNSDVGTVLDVGKWSSSGLENRRYSDSGDFPINRNFNFDLGDPTEFAAYGKDDFAAPYTAGSISITVDTNIVTGTSTAWLGVVSPGDMLVVGKKRYRVKRVQSDTRIILHNYVNPAVAAASSYEILKDMAITLKIYTGSSEYLTLPYDYLARPYDMVHDTLDKPDMPEDFDEVIVDFAAYMIKEDKDDIKSLNTAGLAQAKLQGLKSKFRAVYPRGLQFSPTIPSGMPGR